MTESILITAPRGHAAYRSPGGALRTRGVAGVSVTIDHILAAFDEAGMRNTRPRRLIAERLAECAEQGVDFTGDDLWHELLDVEPTLGRATIFRAIETLVNLKLLDRVTFADGTHRYRVCGAAHHHHLTCVRCHRVVEIEACVPMERFRAIASRNNFALEGHALELYGRCEDCRDTAAVSEPPRRTSAT
jgi:Fur family transcriptional regulator, ferric uptake regulator